MRSAQVSVEFLLIIGIVSAVFLVSIGLLFSFIGDTTTHKDREALDDVAQIIEREVALAKSVDSHYTKTFSLPQTIAGKPYEIDIHPADPPALNLSEVVLSFVDDEYERVLFLEHTKILGIQKGTNQIEQSDEWVIIS